VRHHWGEHSTERHIQGLVQLHTRIASINMGSGAPQAGERRDSDAPVRVFRAGPLLPQGAAATRPAGAAYFPGAHGPVSQRHQGFSPLGFAAAAGARAPAELNRSPRGPVASDPLRFSGPRLQGAVIPGHPLNPRSGP
jgi:hypothetical protein